MASTATSRATPPFSASATASPKQITSTISSRLTAIFIWQARPLPPMRVTFGPIASSTGLARSNAASSPPIITEAWPAFTVTGTAGQRAVEHDRSGLGEFGRDRAARVRLDRAHVDVDAALAQPRHDAVRPERHGLDRRRIGDDGKHDLGLLGDRARRLGRTACRRRSAACALSRERFQPVTRCPAAIRRGTISAPMAPRPTNPMSNSAPPIPITPAIDAWRRSLCRPDAIQRSMTVMECRKR